MTSIAIPLASYFMQCLIDDNLKYIYKQGFGKWVPLCI